MEIVQATSFEIDHPSDSFLPDRSRMEDNDFDMDITPMIDITFLLLIFFLVCSTHDAKTSIDLPKARYGKGVGERNSVMITIGDEITFDENGDEHVPVYLAESKIEKQRLPDRHDRQAELIRKAIENGKREETKQNVVIKADRDVAHREVSRVIKVASEVEGMQIHLAVMEED
jgi:biopolymer transport protein ExbD